MHASTQAITSIYQKIKTPWWWWWLMQWDFDASCSDFERLNLSLLYIQLVENLPANQPLSLSLSLASGLLNQNHIHTPTLHQIISYYLSQSAGWLAAPPPVLPYSLSWENFNLILITFISLPDLYFSYIAFFMYDFLSSSGFSVAINSKFVYSQKKVDENPQRPKPTMPWIQLKPPVLANWW